ncbi:hypothetical protein DL95DRAFT_389009 [Leptodontidium sp. 2 PMI_412]|nr:hypothetical protein DL95DRAFT_389009 [Leptodontidium sp. 2 PMI_412]
MRGMCGVAVPLLKPLRRLVSSRVFWTGKDLERSWRMVFLLPVSGCSTARLFLVCCYTKVLLNTNIRDNPSVLTHHFNQQLFSSTWNF